MKFKCKTNHQIFEFLLIGLTLNFCCFQLALSQEDNDSDRGHEDDVLVFCTTSDAEQRKCQAWADAIATELLRSAQLGHSASFEFALRCTRQADRDQCMNSLANQAADLLTLDAGEVFIAGRHHSLVPIASEVYASNQNPLEQNGYYAVAVVHKHGSIQSLHQLAGARACFPAVGQMAGWVLPLVTLLQRRILPVADCNNMIKSAARYFNASCAPGSLIDKHNPTGDNPLSICSLCAANCAGNEPFAGFLGAFRCLLQRGDVAFLKHNTVPMSLERFGRGGQLLGNSITGTNSAGRFAGTGSGSGLSPFDFSLLCPDGSRAELHSYATCNWGFVPAHAIVTVSSVLPEKREKMQRFLMTSASLYGTLIPNSAEFLSPNTGNSFASSFPTRSLDGGYISLHSPAHSSESNGHLSFNRSFHLFGDSPFIRNAAEEPGDLLFSADTIGLQPIGPGRQTFKGYLNAYVQPIEQLRHCPVPSARLCVTSDLEMKKCSAMSTAFRAQMLKPQLTCVSANSSLQCMQAIRSGSADLAMLDAADIYRGGSAYNLIPIVAERYNLDNSTFYAVAVARQSDPDTDLLHLKSKRSCHSAYAAADGWLIPLHFLLSNNRMRSYGCDSLKAASQFFQKSCAPGALSPLYSKDTWSASAMCELCHGASYRYCSRNHQEPFYGPTGALRCLVEGGGEVAFVRHTTILENTAGRNPMLWSRNVIPDDFELLCRDGTRARHNEYRKCNLGQVPANALVTSGDRHPQQIDAYINLFLLAQELYGSKYSEDYTFKMFVSEPERGVPDLIFQDSTSSLVAVPEYRRHYLSYLGPSFVHAFKRVDCAWSTGIHSAPMVHLIVALVFICSMFNRVLIV